MFASMRRSWSWQRGRRANPVLTEELLQFLQNDVPPADRAGCSKSRATRCCRTCGKMYFERAFGEHRGRRPSFDHHDRSRPGGRGRGPGGAAGRQPRCQAGAVDCPGLCQESGGTKANDRSARGRAGQRRHPGAQVVGPRHGPVHQRCQVSGWLCLAGRKESVERAGRLLVLNDFTSFRSRLASSTARSMASSMKPSRSTSRFSLACLAVKMRPVKTTSCFSLSSRSAEPAGQHDLLEVVEAGRRPALRESSALRPGSARGSRAWGCPSS